MVATVAQVVKLAAETRGERDVVLWRAWKGAPTDANASALLRQIDPLIQREASKWSGVLAKPLLETEGKRLAMQAFKSYDPGRGAALGTHVVNQLQKMSRLSYANQNAARLPENKMLAYHAYLMAHEGLSDELGRAPTSDELADRLGWSLGHVTDYRRTAGRKELLESGGAADSGDAGLWDADVQDHLVDFIHHDLPPVQKAIFEHLTGYAGAERLSNQEIQKRLGLTQGMYSYQKGRLVDHVRTVHEGKR